MNFFQAVFLSVIEGITEFLPISSTGHLILASSLFDIPQTEFTKSFEIFIQLGAILAVLFMYWQTLWQNKILWKKILIAFIPSGIFGFTLYKFIKKFLLGNSLIVAVSLILGGIILILFEKYSKARRHRESNHSSQSTTHEEMGKLTFKSALIIGFSQTLSMIPGVSRSAATIIGGMTVGLRRQTAVEFSFLLAVPTMFAATGLDLIKTGFSFSSYEYWLLFIGFIGSFITAFVTVKYFLRFIQVHSLIVFGVYRIILAVVFLLISFLPTLL